MLDSPLGAATRARVFHQRTRQRPHERGAHIIAAIGALLVHLLCLFAFVLGPAYRVKPPPPPPSKDQFLQIRLIEPPEPPPPPPVRGTPPKQRGPRHQARPPRPVAITERSAQAYAPAAAAPPTAATKPAVAAAVKNRVTAPPSPAKPEPSTPPKPAVATPKPAPVAELQPVPLADKPLVVELPSAALQPPVPPKFQPEAVRPVQAEGNRPALPVTSLALPQVPTPASPTMTLSDIALKPDVAKASEPASMAVTHVDVAAAPAQPELQPIPLPPPPSPQAPLDTQLHVPPPSVVPSLPHLQAASIESVETALEPIPAAPAEALKLERPTPEVKIDPLDLAPKLTDLPTIKRPAASDLPAATPATESLQPNREPSREPATAASVASAESPPLDASAPSARDEPAERDVSRAPDATPQGSNSAKPGRPDGVVEAPENIDQNTAKQTSKTGKLDDQGDKPTPSHGAKAGGEKSAGKPASTDQAGAEQGDKPALGDYVQLKPTGDTEIMRHDAPDLGYKPTRFEQDWAPEGESAVDTALRHAVEKTTIKHTFHLPRGIRVECAVRPLLPIALFGCHNPDPPPKPVDPAVYDRLHLAPARSLAEPSPASGSSVATPASVPTPIKLDNSAACAAARVAGSPPPPGCVTDTPSPRRTVPAPSSSLWVPPSDQFQ